MRFNGHVMLPCGRDRAFGVCREAERLAITRAKRIAHLEAALTRIKTLADAPDPDVWPEAYSGAELLKDWAVKEAVAGLKETP